MTSQRRGRIAVTAVAGLLGLTGVSLVGAGLLDREAAPPAANEIPTRTSPSADASSATPTPSSKSPSSSRKTVTKATPKKSDAGPDYAVLPESVPNRITIPAIDVDNSRFVDLGLADNGEMEAPEDPDEVGWFVGGHTPGSPGVGVIAGHVTWNGAPSPFFKLGKLQRNDTITVRREDGSKATFKVARMSTFPKNDFPTAEVYKAADDPQLVLITCGGKFDADKRYYDSNVIVWADLVSTQRG